MKKKISLKNKNNHEEEHKRMAVELERAEAKLQILLENLPDIVMTVDRDGAITYINHAAVGFAKEEVLGKSCIDLLPLEHRDRCREALRRAYEEGKNDEFEHASAGFTWWVARFVPVKRDGEVVTVMIISIDVTERRKAEEERKKILKAIEIAKESICITNLDGRIVYANEAMNKLFGYKKGELIGELPSILNAGSEPEKIMKDVMKAVEERDFWEGEIHNKRKDGREFISYASISAVRDKDGKVSNFVSTQHETTKSKIISPNLKNLFR